MASQSSVLNYATNQYPQFQPGSLSSYQPNLSLDAQEQIKMIKKLEEVKQKNAAASSGANFSNFLKIGKFNFFLRY